MSYAVRNDGMGWRAVASEKDLMEGEHFSLTQPEITTPAATQEAERERAKAELQPQRDLFLNRLSGIAVFASEQSVIEECAALRAQLLDITKTPAYLAAETFDEMKAALIARYRQIAAGASEAIRNVFRELDA